MPRGKMKGIIDDDKEVEVYDGTDMETDEELDEVDINAEQDIDSLLTRRPQGRPKGVLDYKLPVHPIEGEYRKAEIVAAMVHLYYMQDRRFAPDNVPMHHFQQLLNVSRHTIYRCLEDVKNGKVLALKLHTELMVMSENLLQAQTARQRRARQKMAESQSRVMQRRILERRIKRAELAAAANGSNGHAQDAGATAKVPPKRREVNLSE